MGLVVAIVTVVIGLVLLHLHLRSRKRTCRGRGAGERDSSAACGDVYSYESGHGCRACESDSDARDGGD